MTPEERRRMDRYLDRLERVLNKDNETYRQQRRERRARWRAEMEKKLKPPDEGPVETGTEDDEPKR